MSIMDQVKKNLREWYSLAADRTGEMAKISVRMYDKYGISREIERQLSELGSYVYHAVEQGRTEFAGDTEFQAWIERIKGLEGDLDAKVEEIDEIRQVRQQKQAARDEDDAADDKGDDTDAAVDLGDAGVLVVTETIVVEASDDDAVDEVDDVSATAFEFVEVVEEEQAPATAEEPHDDDERPRAE